MKIKIIDFGGKLPKRAHYNDAGADVFATISKDNCDWYEDLSIEVLPHSIRKIPLGIGLELPDGFVAFVVPRSGMSANKGITTELVPIDSGYRGEIHAIVYNATPETIRICSGDKIAQLIIVPAILAEFYTEDMKQRGKNAFGSTGDK